MPSEIYLNLIFMAGMLCSALPIFIISRRLSKRKDLEIGHMNTRLTKKDFEAQKLQKTIDELIGSDRQARVARDELATRLKTTEKELAGIPALLAENLRLRHENEALRHAPSNAPDTLHELTQLRAELDGARAQAAASQEELAVLWEKMQEPVDVELGQNSIPDPEKELLAEENLELRHKLTTLQEQQRAQQALEQDLHATRQQLRALEHELTTLRHTQPAIVIETDPASNSSVSSLPKATPPQRRYNSPLTRAQEIAPFIVDLGEEENEETLNTFAGKGLLDSDEDDTEEDLLPLPTERPLTPEEVALEDEEDDETARMEVHPPAPKKQQPAPPTSPPAAGFQILGDSRLNPAQKSTILSMYCQFTRTTPAAFSPAARGDSRKAIKEDPLLTRAHKITIETVLETYLSGKNGPAPH